MPIFSVITPNFNSGGKLAQTCESVASQSVEYEHLIMDGNSTDGSLEIARALAETNPRMRVISEPDRGVYDGMNKGIAAARGRYLYFVGAGDTLLPGSLSSIAPHLPSHDNALVYGDALFEGRRYNGKYTKLKLIYTNLCHQAAFYGRGIFNTCGVYDLQYRAFADWELNLRCFGTRKILKMYVPILIANFEAAGISSRGDAQFDHDKDALVSRYLGARFLFLVRARFEAGRLRQKIRMRMKSWAH